MSSYCYCVYLLDQALCVRKSKFEIGLSYCTVLYTCMYLIACGLRARKSNIEFLNFYDLARRASLNRNLIKFRDFKMLRNRATCALNWFLVFFRFLYALIWPHYKYIWPPN